MGVPVTLIIIVNLQSCAEDVLSFKDDVEKCCKFISKMRGKKANGAAILAEFESLLEQEFPDVFPPAIEVEENPQVSSKKRGRSSTDGAASPGSPERHPKKKSARHAEEEAEAPASDGLSASEKVRIVRNQQVYPTSCCCSRCFADRTESNHSEIS
jgi:hypothetical protein